MANGYGMMLDRDLTPELLGVAYAVGKADRDPATSRPTLAVHLRDYVSDQEANNKTKKCLTRVWLNPPPPALPMIRWALDLDEVPERSVVLHYGALLASYPFVGVVAKVVGSHLRSEGQVHARAVREAVQKLVGGSATVDMAARKSYTTLAHLGLIEKNGQLLGPRKDLPSVPGSHGPWLIHALLLTRGAEAIDASSVNSAPELLGMQVPARLTPYPLLTTHHQTSGKVFALKDHA